MGDLHRTQLEWEVIYTREQVAKMDLPAIEAAIKQLEDLYMHLGGTLYPGVVSQELHFLDERRKVLRCTKSS